MEESNIRKYAQLMHDLDLTGLELTEDGATLRLERSQATAPVSVVTTASTETTASPSAPATTEDKHNISVPSPMVGVFYAAPAENQPNFVSVGSEVRRGDVLCIIESMKLMNEIVCEHDGVVTEVCVGNQQVVDYGHPLFRIRKESR